MKSQWMPETSLERPEEFVRLNDNEWLQHVDIHESTMTVDVPDGEEGETEEVPCYEFQTRVMDNKAYEELKDTLYTPAQKETVDLMANSDDNQTVLMEALAEIYEMLATLLPEEEEVNNG